MILANCNSFHTNFANTSLPASSHLELARVAWQKQNWEECDHYLQDTLDAQPSGEAYLLYAWLKLRQAQWSQALKYARLAHQCDPKLVQPYFFEAADQLIHGDYLAANEYFEQVRFLFPEHVWTEDEKLGLQTAWWRELLRLKQANLPQSGLEASQQALKVCDQQPLFLVAQADFMMRLRQFDQAELVIKDVVEQNPYYLPAVQCYRRLLFRRKEYRYAWDIWQRIVPESLVITDNNQIKDRYQTLKNAILQADCKKEETLWKLATALEQFGWEQEALLVYQTLPDSQEHCQRLAQHLLFLQGIQQIIQQSYSDQPISLVGFLDEIGKLAKQYNIPLTPRASQEFDSYFILVREVDPFAMQPGTLGFYLAKYNKVLDVGNNYGVLDARLMNRLSWCQHRYPMGQQELVYQVIMGDETLIDNAIGFHSGAPRVAGRTFLSGKGFYLALDTIRPNMLILKKLQQILSSSIPSPISSPSVAVPILLQPDSIQYDANLVALLLQRSFAQNHIPASPQTSEDWDMLYQAMLNKQIDLVHHHELGHVRDFPQFLPMYKNLDNLFVMLWQNGFNPQKIHLRFENVAEVFGLASCNDPYYYLAQIIERLDVNYSGVFELVYWAWYGKMPQQDPYYQASLNILESLSQQKQQPHYLFFYQLVEQPESEFSFLLHKLLEKTK